MDIDEEENKSFGKSLIFVLSFENIKKSFKDYAIYFLTIVLGVAIFYMFNSLDTQEAMLKVSESTRQIVKLMVEMLGYISVFVSIILGLLIVYANSFLINRRKKEFGIYMLLGMGKGQISKIIILETIFIGIISLFVGLLIRSICFTVYVYISFKIISSKYGKL
jgi:putative ABC transport system permease protein